MEELLYGTAYDLDSLPEDRVEYDLMLMKRAGMNVIRIVQPAWDVLEPEEGTYDFSAIDRMLDAADEAGLKVIVELETGSVPLWLAGKDKAVKPAHRLYAERLLRRIVERSVRHSCVIGYQLGGSPLSKADDYDSFRERLERENAAGAAAAELLREEMEAEKKSRGEYAGEYAESSEQTGAAEGSGRGGYTENAEAGSRGGPAEAAGPAETASPAPGRDQDTDPDGMASAEADSDEKRITEGSSADEIIRMAGIVSACRKPGQFITSLLYSGGETVPAAEAPEFVRFFIKPGASGDQETAGIYIVPGCDSYFPAQDSLTGVEGAFRGDLMRGMTHGNYYVLGTQAQASPWNTPYPGQLRLQAYSYLANGADMVMYSRWHSIHSGPGMYWKGVLSHDMGPNPVYGEIRKTGLEWKSIGDKLVHLRKDCGAALVVDSASGAAFDRLAPVPDCTYQEVVFWLYSSLYLLNIECDIVELDSLDPSAYRMILTPALYSVSEMKILMLRKFVDNGGILVSTFQSFFTDEDQNVYPDSQPHFMGDIFGMSYQQITAPGKAMVGGQPVENLAELVTAHEAVTLANYQHKYWGGYAAATKNQYGLGKAYYIACMMSANVLGRILLEAASDAGLVTEAMDFEWPVIVRSGVSREGNRIHYVLHYSEDERDIVCPYEAAELLSGEEYHIGDVLHLSDWDVRILEEKKRVEDQVTFL